MPVPKKTQLKSNLRTKNSRLPFVFLNLAMSADGKITTANRSTPPFSSPRDREHMLELRATADAVMSGARTVDLNEVNLGPGPLKYRRLRLRRGLAENNLRVVVSGTGSIDPHAHIFQKRFSPIIVLTSNQAPVSRLKILQRLADEVKVFGDSEVNFRQALRWLHDKWSVRRLLCEGGGELNDALFRAGVVDEVHLTLCPIILGGRLAPTIADGAGLGSLAKAAQFKLTSSRRIADELFLVYSRR
jgi:riboflavin-specific deaminase-like protein